MLSLDSSLIKLDSQPTVKKTPAKKLTASSSKQPTLSFAATGRTARGAASKARTKMTEVVSLFYFYTIFSLSTGSCRWN